VIEPFTDGRAASIVRTTSTTEAEAPWRL